METKEKMETANKLIKSVIFLAMGVLGLTLIASNSSLLPNTKILSVQSGSMSPTFEAGSMVVANTSEAQYQTGDIIVFESGNVFVTHRVVEVIENNGISYKTQGDANDSADKELVKAESVLGKVTFSVPFMGRFINFAKTKNGFLLLILIPSLFIIFSELLKIVEEIKKGRKSPQQEIITPLLILITASLLCSQATYAFFHDTGESGANTFSASETFSNLFESNAFTCAAGATTLDETFGTASFNFDNGTFDLKVILSGATPNSTYDIWINQDPGACPLSSPSFPAAIATNGDGNGEKTFENVAKNNSADNFWISAVGGGQVLRSTAIND